MRNDLESAGTPSGRLDRRKFGALALGAASLAVAGPARADAEPEPAPDIEKARKEGTLVIMHGDSEADVAQFLKIYTEKTGLPVVQQRLLPGAALPKIMAEFRSGVREIDAFFPADVGMMELLRGQGRLERYYSREIMAYQPQYRSSDPGFWTTYYMSVNPIMYDGRYVADADAPKTYADLLNPRWARQVGFQNSASGAQYAWWYLVKDVVPAGYWERLATQRPRAYSSSTQMVADLTRGDLKIGGRVSDYMSVQAARKNTPLTVVHPPEGTAVHITIGGVLAGSQRRNAARAYINFLLSREGQTAWNGIQGSYSARRDVAAVDGKRPIDSFKLLLPTDLKDYTSPARHAEFVSLWNKVTGL